MSVSDLSALEISKASRREDDDDINTNNLPHSEKRRHRRRRRRFFPIDPSSEPFGTDITNHHHHHHPASLLRRLRDAAGVVCDGAAIRSLFRRPDAPQAHDGRRIPLRLNANSDANPSADPDANPNSNPNPIAHAQQPLVDPRTGGAFVSNSIRTSRYTVWDFVPKQLLFQFSRIGNFYFLCVGIPQMIPGLSTTGSYTTILPLLFFVCLTMFKEGYDDYRRHRLDKVENAYFATTIGSEDKYSGLGSKSDPNSNSSSSSSSSSSSDSALHSDADSLPGTLEPSGPWARLGRLSPFFNNKKNNVNKSKKKKKKNAARPRPCPADDHHNGLRWVPTRWADIKVGDLLLLSRDEPVPADIALLHSDGENGIAYVDTMALDGETNLKSKHVCRAIGPCGSIKAIAHCRAEFFVEHPNADLFSYEGKVSVDQDQDQDQDQDHSNGNINAESKENTNGNGIGNTNSKDNTNTNTNTHTNTHTNAAPVTMDNVIYRGSVLRNTPRAIGIVVNTGEDCKVRMNANRHPKAKRPALEAVVNGIVFLLALYVVLLSVGVSTGYLRWRKSYERDAWYLQDAGVPFYQIIIAFIIMFNNVIPLSLYVSLEIVKVGQLLLLNSDIDMYDPETDTPARCNTNTILENLGQVGYIFSDKTGTLTDNVMKFRKISVAGTVWLHEMDLEPETATATADATVTANKNANTTATATATATATTGPATTATSPASTPTSPIITKTPGPPAVSELPNPSAAAETPKTSAVSFALQRDFEANRRHSAAYRPHERLSLAIPEDRPDESRSPITPTSRPLTGRRSSSHWRSTGRPDHIQPEVNTADLLDYIRARPHSAFARKAKDYVLALALCHSCLPEHGPDGRVDFQASSPDELALVRAAQELGCLVVQRNSRQITLQTTQPDGRKELSVYEILDVIEFSSARKRMSVVLRYPDGRISVICKGADSAILPRLRLSSLAMQKAHEVRQSAEVEREMFRRSEQMEPRNSFGGRPSLSVRRNPSVVREKSVGSRQPATDRSRSFELNKLSRASEDQPRASINRRGVSFDFLGGPYHASSPAHNLTQAPERLGFLDDPSIYDESEVFTKCFKHLDDFATEGLRTLLFAQKFVSEQEYRFWKKLYDDATTSLANRQEKIEAAGDMIEQSFELVGGSAIEDKLQKGVPETVDRLRRANIKIWMLTGDKRETAINIAHSARICRPGSDLFVLDAAKGPPLADQLAAMADDIAAGSAHSVVVIDGLSLAAVEKAPALREHFFSVMLRVDSVICCRASPAQKALLVRAVRERLKASPSSWLPLSLSRSRSRGSTPAGQGLTLAIGDGANDLAMIQASHVGVGISGKEGLQAARVADYAIAQFRFLQKMLLVHGRWNYVRTAKFIVCTFWKEMFFYIPTALYQRHAGFTGTSLYEATSLTVFNTLFTSLALICMGIWEQDLGTDTLLALPELYVFGQRNMGLNFWKYVRWMALAAAEGVIVWYGIWAGYGSLAGPGPRDGGLYALGSMAFTIGVLWVNWKLFIFETHYKPAVVMACFFITTLGWFLWLAFLSLVYAASPSGKYAIRDAFTKRFGGDAAWWATVFIVLGILGMMELLFKVAKRGLRVLGLWRRMPCGGRGVGLRGRLRGDVAEHAEDLDVEVWQELEQDRGVRAGLARMTRDDADEEGDDDDDEYDGIEIEVSSR